MTIFLKIITNFNSKISNYSLVSITNYISSGLCEHNKIMAFPLFPSPKQFALAFSSLSMVSLFLFVLTETLGYMFEFQCCRSKINLVTIEFNIPNTQMKC